MREVELSHVVGALFVGGPQGKNEIDGVDLSWPGRVLFAFILSLDLLLFGVLILKGWLIALQGINSALGLTTFLWWNGLQKFALWVLLVTRPLDDFVWLRLIVSTLPSYIIHPCILLFVRIHRFLVWRLWICISSLIIFIFWFGRFIFLRFRRVLILSNRLFGLARIIFIWVIVLR